MKLNHDLNKILRHGRAEDIRHKAQLLRKQHDESAPLLALGLMLCAVIFLIASMIH